MKIARSETGTRSNSEEFIVLWSMIKKVSISRSSSPRSRKNAFIRPSRKTSPDLISRGK